MDLTFQELVYKVQVKTVKAEQHADLEAPDQGAGKTILSGISGRCRAGHVQAIMGPSGAGKTSLLDILAGRKLQSSGHLFLGAEAASPAMIRRYAAYVQQDDAIMASQTAREAVQMAALLTLPGNMARKTKLERAEKALQDFSLLGCADTPVGDPVGKMKGLSGGERKRCAVAMSAVREPKILFLDEPTSGLDAYKAHLLVKIMKEMAQKAHSTIVCTIHQPSSDIFALFDDLMLLLGGQVVFNDKAAEAVAHFGTAGFPCPQYANPADFLFMHVLTNTDGASAAGDRQQQLVAAWQGSGRPMALAVEPPKTGEGVSVTASNAEPPQAPGFLMTFPALLRRGLNDLRRNVMRGRAPFGQALVMAVILGVIWWQIDTDQAGIQDRTGLLFFVCVNGIMQNVMAVLTTFANERGAVLREQENGMYTTLPYFCARVLVDLPLKLFPPIVFATPVYFMCGLQVHVEKFFIFVAFNILLALSGNAIGLFLACIFPDVTLALAVAPVVLTPLIMFSGFVLNTDSIPVYLQWLEWLSPPKYAFAALAQSEFDGLALHCKEDEWRSVHASDGQMVRICPFESGSGPNGFINTLNFQDFLSIGNCALFLVGLTVCFSLLAYMALLWASWKTRVQAAR